MFQLEDNRPPRPVEEISAREYFDVAMEPNGNFWLATSDGLFRYAPQAWRTPLALQNVTNEVQCLTEDVAGRLWFASPGGLHVLNGDQHVEFTYPAGAKLTAVRALYPLPDGSIMLDAAEGLFQFRSADRSFSLVCQRSSSLRLAAPGLLADGGLCVQTCDASPPGAACRLEIYDGTRFLPFTNSPPATVFGGRLTGLFQEASGDFWLGGEHGMARWHDNKWRIFNAAVASAPENAGLFAATADGKIWCAAQDKCWKFSGQNWSPARAWPGVISALAGGPDGSLWLVSNFSLHRLLPKGFGSKMVWMKGCPAPPSARSLRITSAASGPAPRAGSAFIIPKPILIRRKWNPSTRRKAACWRAPPST